MGHPGVKWGSFPEIKQSENKNFTETIFSCKMYLPKFGHSMGLKRGLEKRVKATKFKGFFWIPGVNKRSQNGQTVMSLTVKISKLSGGI